MSGRCVVVDALTIKAARMPVIARYGLRYGLLIVLLSFGSVAHALGADQPFTAVIETTPDDPGIDDRLMLRLSIEVPANLLVNFPRLGTELGDFVVVGQRALEPVAEAAESREWVQQYRLEPQTTGDLLIPPLIVTVQDPTTLEAIGVSTPETEIHIASIVPPDTDLREIKDILPPVSLPSLDGPRSEWLPIAIGLAIAMLALAAWGGRRNAPEAIAVVEQPPHQKALDALEALRGETSSDEKGVERFHIRLAAILRRYLQEGLAVAAPLKTTEELLADAALVDGRHPGTSVLLKRPLGQCDLVKFARHQPSDSAMQTIWEDVVAFVERTSAERIARTEDDVR